MRQLALALSVFAAAGCFLVLDPDGLELAASEDAGIADASSDAGPIDAGGQDAGTSESDAGGVEDAGVADAGAPDAGARCESGMVLVPGGTFALAATGDQLTVNAFCLDLTEVPVTAYLQFGQQAGHEPGTSPGCNWNVQGRDVHPINCVSQIQATQYCNSVGKRLPNEVEWEWAARGGLAARLYPWGNDPPSFDSRELCWTGSSANPSTCAVAVHPLGNSVLGISDLAGNVAEWTSSADPNNTLNVVHRGGSWMSVAPEDVQTGHRHTAPRESKDAAIGFRCAKTP